MEEITGDLVCGDRLGDVEEQDGLLKSFVRAVDEAGEDSEQQQKEENENKTVDVSAVHDGVLEVKGEQDFGYLVPEKDNVELGESRKGLISGVRDGDACETDAGNINSEGDKFLFGLQQETADCLSIDASLDSFLNKEAEVLDSCLNRDRTKALCNHEVNEGVPDGSSQPCYPVDENNIHDPSVGNERWAGNAAHNESVDGEKQNLRVDVAPDVSSHPSFAVGKKNVLDDASAGNESMEGNATCNESVNAGVEEQNLKTDGDEEKEDDNRLANSANRKTRQDGTAHVSSSELPENIEQGSGEGDNSEREISLIQECKETNGIIVKCQNSTAAGLRERGDLHDHSVEQGLGEQDSALMKMIFEVMETKEPVQGGDDGQPVLDQRCIANIPVTSVEQQIDKDSDEKEFLSAEDNAIEAPHYLLSANEVPENGLRDTVLVSNECSPDFSNPSVRKDKSCKHDSPVAGNPTSVDNPQKGFHLDAFPPSEEAKQEEQDKGDLQAEESTANVFGTRQKTMTSLAAAIQLRDDVSTFVEEEGTSHGANVSQEKEDFPLRDLMQTKGKSCGKQSVSTFIFSSESEKTELTKSEASVFGKGDIVPNTDMHLKLEKQLTGAAVSNHEFSAKECEASSTGAKERFEVSDKKENNMNNCLSTSPSSQNSKKHRHRKSSNGNINIECLSLGNCLPEHKISVGDLVWGKIKSHPWWPGQIFDPSDASESASKVFQRVRKDRLLVAFFGDATFGWCEESQLMPFQSNFSEKAKQTTVKAFQNAVMDALDELARRVELGLTCSCQVEEARHILESKGTFNFGIRQGAVVNNHRDILQAPNTFDPLTFLSTIQNFAKSPLMEHDLEVAVGCAQASAFLTFKGLLVSGKISFETSGNEIILAEKQGSAGLGPSLQGYNGSSGKHKRNMEEKHPRRTKKRKINDLIAKCEPSHEAEEDLNGDDETLLEMAGRIKKRKINDLIAECEPSDGAEEDLNGHDETLLDIAAAGSYTKVLKRKLASSLKCQESNPSSTKTGEDANTGNMAGKEVRNDMAKPIEKGSLPRRESPLKIKQYQKSKSVASHVVNNDCKALQSKKVLNSIPPAVDPDTKKPTKTFKFGECMRKVASELTSTPPESKSISLANVDINICSSRSTKRRTTRPAKESSSIHELLSELLIVAQDPLFWAKKKKLPLRLINSFLQFRNAVFEKSSSNSDVSKASALNFANEPNELKSPQSSMKFPGSSSIGDSKGTDWIDRESSLRPTSQVGHAKLKRKAEFSFEGARKRMKHTIRLPSPPWSNKGLKNEPEDKTGDRYGKRYSRRLLVSQSPVTSLTGFSTDNNANQNPAALFMRFSKGFALPSETELKAKFARFGPLEISETKVFRRSGCAQVVFKTASAAEAAFNFASENNVFGSAQVSFRLRYPSSGKQADTIEKKDHGKHEKHIQQDDRQSHSLKVTFRDEDGHQEKTFQSLDSIAFSSEKPSRPNTSGEPQLLLIQQNLEMLTSMLSRSDCTSSSATATSDNITPDSKRDIMDEMMSLLQKVSALVSAPP